MTVLLARRDQAEPAPDARGRAGVRPLRPVREHRPRQQLGPRRPARPRDERHRLHRGRLRGRHGRREVLRHQVPRVGPAARRGGHRGHGPGPEDARRRRQDRGRQAARSGAPRARTSTRSARGAAEPRQADRERPAVRRAGRSSRSTRSRPTRRPRSRRSARSPWRPALGTRSSPRTSPTAARAPRTWPQAVWDAAEEGAPDFTLLYPDEAPLARRRSRRSRRRSTAPTASS